MLHELLSYDKQGVIFLNSNLDIIRLNEFADRQYAVTSQSDRSFQALLGKHNLNLSWQFAADVPPVVQQLLKDKITNFPDGRKVTWHVEYFPELFEMDFKLALLDVTTEKTTPTGSHYCHSVLETVNNMVQTANEDNFSLVLSNIVQSLPGRAHIKSNGDFAYRMTNAATLKLLGMDHAQQLIGLDDFLVSKHMGKKWPARLAGDLQQMDHTIIQSGVPLVGKEEMPYLDADGNLVVHALTKIPIYNLQQQQYGILTLAMDMTHLKDITFMKNAYFNLYEKPREAHFNFIKHLGLDKIHVDMNDLITIRELECLILFAKGMTAKEIGRQLDISNRTVERHFESVKAKFNCMSRSDAITLFLSNFSFYTPGAGGYV